MKKEVFLFIIYILVREPFSKAEFWSGDSSITAIQGESVTITWTVNLTASDASKTWTYVKISHANQDANTEELVTYRKTGEKTILNSRYQSRSSDLTFNVSQSGPVVTILFTIANLMRDADMKDYKATLGFPSDASTYPEITTLTILVKPNFTEFTIHPEKNSFCLQDLVNLTCKAIGIPPAVVSLYLNGHLVEKRNISGSFLISLSVKGENDFHCVSNNTAGFGQTRTIKVFVKEPPKITRCKINDKEVTSEAVNEGTEVTLSCELSGSEPFSIIWNKEREQNHLPQTNILTFGSINRTDSGKYRVTVYSGKECEKTVTKTLQLTVNYLDKPEIDSKKYRVVSSVSKTARFKIIILGNPHPSLTCRREGGPSSVTGNVSVVKQESGPKSTFSVVILGTEDEEYYCDFKNIAGNRLIKLHLYKRIPPILINGTFTLTNKTWKDDLSLASSDSYVLLKIKVTQALNLVYESEEFVSAVHVLGFVKGSVVVNFQLTIIANVPDPIILLKNAVDKNGGQLNGLLINRNSIKQGYTSTNEKSKRNAKPTEPDDMTGTYVGIAVGVVVGIILLVILLKCYFKPRKKRRTYRGSSGTEMQVYNDSGRSEMRTCRDSGGSEMQVYNDSGRSGQAFVLENVRFERENRRTGITDRVMIGRMTIPNDRTASWLPEFLSLQPPSRSNGERQLQELEYT